MGPILLFTNEEGNIGKLQLITTLLFLIIAIFFFKNYIHSSNIASELDLISSMQLINMESEGYLTSIDEKDLIDELENLGLTNIKLDGSTKEKVNGGNIIVLEIAANNKNKDVNTKKVSRYYNFE